MFILKCITAVNQWESGIMTFEDYAEQGFVYHVISITDLRNTLRYGIRYDGKKTYTGKYSGFHGFFDTYRPEHIPDWVERKRAVFASIGFGEGHKWHSHSAILKIKVYPDRCWICNENLANFVYEPFILQEMEGFGRTKEYMETKGREFVRKYWNNSLSYNVNLDKRYDKREGYDAEVLIMHTIPPENIECLHIVSDHSIMGFFEWQECFVCGNPHTESQYSKYLQPDSISTAENAPGLQ